MSTEIVRVASLSVDVRTKTKKKPKHRRHYRYEELRHLHAGTDRGGITRSWQELAEITGLTPTYVRNRINGGPDYKLPKIDVVAIDPRQYEPELKAYLSDEDVAAWQRDPRCLCGCGVVPKRETQKTGGMVPWGAYRLYVAGHYSRTPWMRERNTLTNADPTKRLRSSLSQRRDTLDTTVLAGMVEDYLADHGVQLKDLATEAFMSHSHLSSIKTGKFPRIKPATMGRLLAAMGEPMRPEIAAAYRKWMRSNQMTPQEVTVLR